VPRKAFVITCTMGVRVPSVHRVGDSLIHAFLPGTASEFQMYLNGHIEKVQVLPGTHKHGAYGLLVSLISIISYGLHVSM